MCQQNSNFPGHRRLGGHHCGCQCRPKFLSKKMQVEALKENLKEIQERANDLKEYIKELEA